MDPALADQPDRTPASRYLLPYRRLVLWPQLTFVSPTGAGPARPSIHAMFVNEPEFEFATVYSH